MKHTQVLYIAAGALLLAASACNNAGESSADTIAFKTVTSEKTYRLAGTAADYEAEQDLNFQCSASLLLPTSLMGGDVKELNDAIIKTALDTTGTNTRALIEDCFRKVITDGAFTPVDTTAGEDFSDGLYILTGSVVNLTDKLMAYSVQSAVEYPRQAHGMYGTTYINYDIKDGHIIELADLFTNEGLAALPEILAETATRMQSTLGPTTIEALPSGNNYYINTDNELIFSYSLYEVASFAQGEINVPVQPYLVAEYLTPYGKKLLLNYSE